MVEFLQIFPNQRPKIKNVFKTIVYTLNHTPLFTYFIAYITHTTLNIMDTLIPPPLVDFKYPEKFSTWVQLALADFEKTLEHPLCLIDMSYWIKYTYQHNAENELQQLCQVCFAGSVLFQQVFDSQKYSVTDFAIVDSWLPLEFRALNTLRYPQYILHAYVEYTHKLPTTTDLGVISEHLNNIPQSVHEAHHKLLKRFKQPVYGEHILEFKEYMDALIFFLKTHNL